MSSKIGFLLPNSEVYPLLITDFLNGFKYAYSQNQLPIPAIHFEGIGNGTDASILRLAEKIIIQENIDMIIGFCGHNHLEKMMQLMKIYQKSFVHTDFGGTLLDKDLKDDYTVHLSLNIWESFYYAGIYAAQNIGQQVAILNSFYEGGYQLLYGFLKGFEQAGGQVKSIQVATSDYKNYDFDTLMGKVTDHNPDFIFSNFTHKESEIVFQKMKDKKVFDKLPVIYNPLANHVFAESVELSNPIMAFGSYFINPKNYWEIGFREMYKKAANEATLLGYEAGLVAIKTLEKMADLDLPIHQALSHEKIMSPRGEITVNQHHESTFESIFIKKYDSKSSLSIEKLPLQSAIFAGFTTESIRNAHSLGGWYNPYLCT